MCLFRGQSHPQRTPRGFDKVYAKLSGFGFGFVLGPRC